MPIHDIVDAAKIKAQAAILRFHPRQKLAADPQIVFGSRRMPVLGRLIPLRDVIRLIALFAQAAQIAEIMTYE